jgi:hypothetical protein
MRWTQQFAAAWTAACLSLAAAAQSGGSGLGPPGATDGRPGDAPVGSPGPGPGAGSTAGDAGWPGRAGSMGGVGLGGVGLGGENMGGVGSMGPQVRSRIEAHMRAMEDLRQRMRTATTPEQQQSLMNEHLQLMDENLSLMQMMMGSGAAMPGMPGGLGPPGSVR